MFCCQQGCVPEGWFLALTGLRIPHLYNGHGGCDHLQELTTQMSQKCSRESMILILRSFLSLPPHPGPYIFVQPTNMY